MGSSSRPMTPNSQQQRGARRHSHRSSGLFLLSQSPKIHYPVDPDNLPLESSTNTEKFEKLSDCIEELDSNMIDLVSIHEAVSNGFNESFASFLYGLSITMWCVDYPGCPTRNSWEKLQRVKDIDSRIQAMKDRLAESKEENDRLKNKLASLEDRKKTPTHSNLTRREYGRLIPPQRKDEESSLTSEGSFVTNPTTLSSRVSRIPQPPSQLGRRQPVLRSTELPPKRGSDRLPNLNQPPRYLRGLFDSGGPIKSSSDSASHRTKRKQSPTTAEGNNMKKPTIGPPLR